MRLITLRLEVTRTFAVRQARLRLAVPTRIVSMRRLSISWLLALLLVLSQQGAVLHTLGHLGGRAGATGTNVRADTGLTENGPCPTCAAFAQLANPVAPHVASLHAAPATYAVSPHRCCAAIGADSPNPRSRGPPHA